MATSGDVIEDGFSLLSFSSPPLLLQPLPPCERTRCHDVGVNILSHFLLICFFTASQPVGTALTGWWMVFKMEQPSRHLALALTTGPVIWALPMGVFHKAILIINILTSYNAILENITMAKQIRPFLKLSISILTLKILRYRLGNFAKYCRYL